MNKKDALYGGSFENRIRFLMNTLKKAREKVGRSYDEILNATNCSKL
jgi:2,4-dienoyl-CoA reductase-like NADH-dependent reductase (Old Yellow Enzyme family)